MSIDATKERIISFAKAGTDHLFASPVSVGRYTFKGLLPKGDPDAPRVKLESILIGGRRYTSVEACQRFIERLNVPTEAEPIRSPGERRKAVAAADAALQAAGI